jgi:site-specific DNA recombinase
MVEVVEVSISVLQRSPVVEPAGRVEQVLVYLRISEDRTGEEAGVDRQRDDCLTMCTRLGLEVSSENVFMDNDTSAYLNKKRPAFARLLERVKAGPSRVVVWHVDRLYRRPRELEDLIDLVETHPIRIEAVMGGAFDLNTHEGRLMARQLVAMAAYESGHKADRIRRANRQKAERGDWHGAAKFGYGTGGVLIPGQAAVVREMADRFLAGHSLHSITGWLNQESGFPAPQAATGKTLGVWHATTVKSILVSARISGQRAYDPGWRTGDPPAGREILGPGSWEAIITPEETARIRSIFANPDRRVGASSINLLSAIATCGKCGSGLVAGRHRNGSGGPGSAKRFYYRCMTVPGHPERGGLTVSGPALEELVSQAVILRLAATTLTVDTLDSNGAITDAMGRIMAARHRMEDLARDYGAGLLARSEYHAGRVAAQNIVHDGELALGKVNRNSALKWLPIGDDQALRRAWHEDWSIPQKRAILSTLIDTLVVNPDPNCGSRFRPQRVQLTFKA